ncbi:MAG: 50S ribosomal protein L22, partial [Candidatus Buchananbacteria bacterium]|nr:50S ribosomal protein L22 [Candidatus Buchananbacteria bacterium]
MVEKKPKVVEEIVANGSFVRMSGRKVRLVGDQIRGKQVEDVLNNLQFLNKAAVRPLVKLLNSAVSNANHNFGFDKK